MPPPDQSQLYLNAETVQLLKQLLIDPLLEAQGERFRNFDASLSAVRSDQRAELTKLQSTIEQFGDRYVTHKHLLETQRTADLVHGNLARDLNALQDRVNVDLTELKGVIQDQTAAMQAAQQSEDSINADKRTRFWLAAGVVTSTLTSIIAIIATVWHPHF